MNKTYKAVFLVLGVWFGSKCQAMMFHNKPLMAATHYELALKTRKETMNTYILQQAIKNELKTPWLSMPKKLLLLGTSHLSSSIGQGIGTGLIMYCMSNITPFIKKSALFSALFGDSPDAALLEQAKKDENRLLIMLNAATKTTNHKRIEELDKELSSVVKLINSLTSKSSTSSAAVSNPA